MCFTFFDSTTKNQRQSYPELRLKQSIPTLPNRNTKKVFSIRTYGILLSISFIVSIFAHFSNSAFAKSLPGRDVQIEKSVWKPIQNTNTSAEIRCYSQDQLIYEGKSIGVIKRDLVSKNFLFQDRKTGKTIEVPGNCVISYDAVVPTPTVYPSLLIVGIPVLYSTISLDTKCNDVSCAKIDQDSYEGEGNSSIGPNSDIPKGFHLMYHAKSEGSWGIGYGINIFSTPVKLKGDVAVDLEHYLVEFSLLNNIYPGSGLEIIWGSSIGAGGVRISCTDCSGNNYGSGYSLSLLRFGFLFDRSFGVALSHNVYYGIANHERDQARTDGAGNEKVSYQTEWIGQQLLLSMFASF